MKDPKTFEARLNKLLTKSKVAAKKKANKTAQAKKRKSQPTTFSYIFLLPGETTKAVVQYSPDLRISALLPPLERLIETRGYDYDKFTDMKTQLSVEVPAIIWHQFFSFQRVGTPVAKYRLWAVEPSCLEKDAAIKSIRAGGLGTAGKDSYEDEGGPHVQSNGLICLGGVDRPRNLRHLNNRFWSSLFEDINSDDAYHTEKFPLDITNHVCGFKSWTLHGEMAKAVFATTDPSALKLFPEEAILDTWTPKTPTMNLETYNRTGGIRGERKKDYHNYNGNGEHTGYNSKFEIWDRFLKAKWQPKPSIWDDLDAKEEQERKEKKAAVAETAEITSSRPSSLPSFLSQPVRAVLGPAVQTPQGWLIHPLGANGKLLSPVLLPDVRIYGAKKMSKNKKSKNAKPRKAPHRSGYFEN